jgi:hypothetical protein
MYSNRRDKPIAAIAQHAKDFTVPNALLIRPARIPRLAALAAVGLIVAGCAHSQEVSPPSTATSTSVTPSATPTVTPTEKGSDPTGGNKFTPPVTAPGAPTVAPGLHPGINGVP